MSNIDPNLANERRNRTAVVIASACLAFTLGMVGVAYAAVPLYEIFCQVTGYGGTTQRAETGAARVLDEEVLVRFDGNTSPDLPWSFKPNDREMTVKLGETNQTSFHVKNESDRPVTGQAVYNVTPNAAGLYFNKIACFCFTEQTLQPGEEIDMPIVFYVDPDILESDELKSLPGITLSYTFFALDGGAAESAQSGQAGEDAEQG